MEKHILSKSTYIKGEQCLKQLYLHKKRAFLRDRMPAERLAIFRRGTNVGIYAQDLFPGGIDAGPKHPSQYRKAVELTSKLIAQGQEIIYEAGFQSNKTLILLDILVRNGDSWDAYEVKSSKKLSETYYKDAALQFFVLEEYGLKINSFSLIHINENYIRKDNIDIKKLFIITDVTEEVKNRKEYVRTKIEEEITILEKDHSPKIEIGTHCFSPYDCDFIGHCWKRVEKPSIFDVPSINLDKQFELYYNNKTLTEIAENNSLNNIQIKQIESQISKEEIVDITEDDINRIRIITNNKEKYIFLKIIRFTPALPLWEGTKPYEHIPFAISYMPINGNINNAEYFVYKGDKNPNETISEKINTILEDKEVIIYDIEKNDIEGFNMANLLKSGSYYHPAITKDYSNKSVSKAMGIKPPWKGISSDIVAAQYYDEILRKHKNSIEKEEAIYKYLKRELEFLQKFWNKICTKS